MKIYLAGPWVHKFHMPVMCERLEAAGHTVTHKWWEVEGDVKLLKEQDPNFDEHAYHKAHAELDYAAVKSAQLLVVLNSTKSEGKATEQGIALADNKPIIIIGEKGLGSGNIFHFLRNYMWAKNFDEVMNIIETISWLLREGE